MGVHYFSSAIRRLGVLDETQQAFLDNLGIQAEPQKHAESWRVAVQPQIADCHDVEGCA